MFSHFTTFVCSYGPGEAGIERLDLLVGDMYEAKVHDGFALSETSFIIFVLMASRRLDADPFLNELYTEEYYSKFGLDHVKKNDGLIDLIDRHYPELVEDFKDKKGKNKQSAFKPTLSPDDWKNAVNNGLVPKDITDVWETSKKENNKFFDELEKETQTFTKNLRSNSIAVFKPEEWTLTIIGFFLLLVILYRKPWNRRVGTYVLTKTCPNWKNKNHTQMARVVK